QVLHARRGSERRRLDQPGEGGRQTIDAVGSVGRRVVSDRSGETVCSGPEGETQLETLEDGALGDEPGDGLAGPIEADGRGPDILAGDRVLFLGVLARRLRRGPQDLLERR